jgi:hypothetical protein
MINAYAKSLEMLYLGAIVSGAGGGAVYGHVRRQRGEMVSRSPRSRGWPNRSRVRCRRSIDRDSHPLRDRQLRLQRSLPLVRNCPRRGRAYWLLGILGTEPWALCFSPPLYS